MKYMIGLIHRPGTAWRVQMCRQQKAGAQGIRIAIIDTFSSVPCKIGILPRIEILWFPCSFIEPKIVTTFCGFKRTSNPGLLQGFVVSKGLYNLQFFLIILFRVLNIYKLKKGDLGKEIMVKSEKR